MHASEQQIVIKKRTTKSHRNPRFFCPLLRAVHYWELLLNKNCREAGFCPLLRAFPLLRSALLRALSVFFFLQKVKQVSFADKLSARTVVSAWQVFAKSVVADIACLLGTKDRGLLFILFWLLCLPGIKKNRIVIQLAAKERPRLQDLSLSFSRAEWQKWDKVANSKLLEPEMSALYRKRFGYLESTRSL